MEDAYASDYASFWLRTSSRSYLHDISHYIIPQKNHPNHHIPMTYHHYDMIHCSQIHILSSMRLKGPRARSWRELWR